MINKIYLSLTILFMSSGAYALDLIQAYQRAKDTDPNWQANVLQYNADQLERVNLPDRHLPATAHRLKFNLRIEPACGFDGAATPAP